VGTAKAKKRRRTIKERRDIVEETLVPGASVARVARQHDVNANQVFYWRKLFREGRLGISLNPPLLPVKVEAEQTT
jgi:transposase